MQVNAKIKSFIFPGIIILLWLIIFITNFPLNTYFLGWDNLAPELNPLANLKRAIFASWQQYQGLGLNGGMGHASDLIRQIFLLPLSLILPTSSIRYIFHSFMLLLGPLSLYFGIQKIFKTKPVFAFCSALFYLLSFGTIQNFWVPFEPFSSFYGFFPLLIFSFLAVFRSPTRKNFLIFALINLLAAPSFYVPTVFIVYLLCLFSFIFWRIIFQPRTHFKTSFLSLILVFLVNSFWLLPFFYFFKNDSYNPQLAFGNIMASEETVQRNQFRGNLSDFFLLRGYYYDLEDNGLNLMSPWHEHFSRLFSLEAGYLPAVFVVIGLIYLFQKLRSHKITNLGLITLFLICATALLSATPPFSFINNLLRSAPLVNQVFRSPYTKFIVPTIFIFSLLLAFGLESINQLFQNKIKIILISLVSLSLIYSSLPVFTGHYFYSQLKQTLPQDYTDLFNYFKNQPKDGRIMNLPAGNYWGWTTYRFGIHGSGFIWYGIEQPILDRAFDVWNLKNEQYYWELSFAIQKQDSVLFENILQKYNVSHVVFDNNVFFPGDQVYSKTAANTKNILDQIPSLAKEKETGLITIYHYQPSHRSAYIIKNSQNIGISQFSYFDPAFSLAKNYYTDKPNIITFPFSGLFTRRLQTEIPFNIKIENNQLTLTDSQTGHIYQTEVSPVANFQSQSEYLRMDTSVSKDFFVPQFENVFFNQSYLVKITYRHIQGFPLLLAGFDYNHHFYFFNTKLDDKKDNWVNAWFVVPKQENYPSNSNLNLLFNNTTFTKQNSINDIKSIDIYAFPFEEIINTHLPQVELSPSSVQEIDNQKSSLFFTIAQIDASTNNDQLVLSQSYHKGWIAFYFDHGVHFLKHTTVNNWANGWYLTNSSPATVYIIFWPQIFEFIGLALLPLTFLWLSKSKKLI